MIERAGACIASAAALASTILIGCAGALPEPIYANQVDEYFPEEPAAPASAEEPSDDVAGDDAAAVPGDDAATEDATATTEDAAVATDDAAVAPDAGAVAPETLAPEAVAAASFRAEAEQCAARLNGHRDTAEVVSIIQGIISGVGGAAGGAGGALSAIDFGNPDITTAMGVMASIGAGVTLVGNFIIGLLANPVEELRRHGDAQRSWELAIELRYANADPDAIRESLLRCTRDEAPPVRTAGSGEPFSL